MTRPSLVALVLLVFASLSEASPLQGSGYPHYDTMFQHQHEDTKELCHTLRRHMDVFLRSKTFRCERLPAEAPGRDRRGNDMGDTNNPFIQMKFISSVPLLVTKL